MYISSRVFATAGFALSTAAHAQPPFTHVEDAETLEQGPRSGEVHVPQTLFDVIFILQLYRIWHTDDNNIRARSTHLR